MQEVRHDQSMNLKVQDSRLYDPSMKMTLKGWFVKKLSMQGLILGLSLPYSKMLQALAICKEKNA
jgi:hypothetical protein